MTDTPKEPPKPCIEPLVNGPYLVRNLKDFKNSRGEAIETQPEMRLCRCGGSSFKPFCDSTHRRIAFRSDKGDDRLPDREDIYDGKEITIHDNRGVCAHAAYCTSNSPAVFDTKKDPWIEPDAGDPEETARTIKMCPSGALSYTRNGILHKDQNRQPGVTIARDGPDHVIGDIELNDPTGSEPASREHYALYLCGASKNKPFCDGRHRRIRFRDKEN